MEVWKEIEGYEGRYEVSDNGQVRSMARKIVKSDGKPFTTIGKKYKLNIGIPGYYEVTLVQIPRSFKRNYVHRLVAQSFIPNPEQHREVNHIDGNKLNNHISNLEWCDHKQNMEHAGENGLMKPKYGEQHKGSKVNNEDVVSMREMRLDGYTYQAIADKYNISKPNAFYIISRKHWKHIA